MSRRGCWIGALLAVAAAVVLIGAVAIFSGFAWWHSYGMREPVVRGWSQTLPVRPWLHRPGLPLHRTWVGFPALLCGLGLLCPASLVLLIVALLAGLLHRHGRGPGLSRADRSWHQHVQQHDVPGPSAGSTEPFNAKMPPGQQAEQSPGDKPGED
jgi:hypothetical protein